MPAIFPRPDKSSPLTEPDGRSALQSWFDFWGYLESQVKSLAAQIAALVILAPATQADQETATSNTVAVTPGTQKFHPGHPKAWALLTQAAGVYTLAASYGIASINKTGTGVVEVTLSTAFSSTSYAVIACPVGSSTILDTNVTINSTTKVTVTIIRSSTEAATDGGFAIMFFGDQ